MQNIKVALLVRSLRKDSIILKLARAVETLAPAHLSFQHVGIEDLPLYTREFDSGYPQVCQRLKQEVAAADALLFVTPEYNRSVPGVLKSALDIGSRPRGANSFAGKPAAMLGASPGAAGTAMAQQHLRNILAYLDVALLAQPEVYLKYTDGLISDDGTVQKYDTRNFLQKFVDSYVAWVAKIQA